LHEFSIPRPEVDVDVMYRAVQAALAETSNRVMRATIRVMREQSSGNILNISSVAGVTGLPTAGVYSATKHAVIGLTLQLHI
jgi:NAD(P)-dependent dehydrogenase (short-subunit alcohol dehydrogenase family)